MSKVSRILYVEDEAGLRELIPEILESFGYKVQTAVDGADGLKTVLQDPEAFDLVITDIRMPVMDGIEFVRRARRSNYHVPVIVFSAFGTDLYEQEITGLNIAATVEKGEMEKLIAAVARVMGAA